MTATLTDPAAIEAELQRRFAERPTGSLALMPLIRTPSGATFSVQGSDTHYSIRHDAGPYMFRAVEVLLDGYPGRKAAKVLQRYRRKASRWGDDVLGYVPTTLVAKAIAAAGGLIANR